MGRWQQYNTALACSFGSLVMGLLNVWPSYTLSLYESKNTTLLSAPMSEVHSSLLGSLPSLGAMLGTAVVGPIIERIGRQKGGFIISLPFVISWIIIDQTSSSVVILAARFLSGVAAGAFLVYAPMFISEIAEDSIRGTLASGPVSFYCFGALLSYLIGWFSNYRTIIWINLASSALCSALCFTVVESPLYLLRRNREEDARVAIAQYRGTSPTSKQVLEELSRLKAQITPSIELLTIKDDIEINSKGEKAEEAEKNKLEAEKEKLNPKSNTPTELVKMSPFKLLYKSPASRRAFTVVATVLTLQVFMGMVPVQVFAKDLFAEAAPNLSSHFCSVLFALVMVIGCVVSATVADRAGRRVLIITSCVLVSLCMASLGFLLQSRAAPPWVPAALILLYCFSFTCGAGTVPYVLLAEVFVPEVQGVASMLLVEWVWFINFAIIALYRAATKLLGTHAVFYVFACVGALNTTISFLHVPETKGLSNEQIQDVFSRRRNKNSV